MASPLPSWLPYETKDCSQGFCSVYCPQWCYIIFPPPPPFFVYDENDDSSAEGSTLSPLIIAIIGVLASAILLVSYYTLVSKYCRRRGTPLRLSPFGPAAAEGRSHVHDTWHSFPSDGLDEDVISKIQMYIYRRGDGVVGCSDCSVCLGEFREDESLRLLPKCRHAFHVRCIDTWLRSHSNCPLCRANIVLPLQPRTPEIGREESHDIVVIQGSEDDGDDSLKETPEGREGNYSVVDIGEDGGGARRIRRSFSLDSSRRGRISVADILKVSMEDEYVMASCHTFVVDEGSCERETGEDSKSRSSHPVVSPVRMKRSVSSGRFGLMKGRSSVLRV